MKPSPSSGDDEQDREIIKLLKALGSSESRYPPELLAARRAAFLTRVEQLATAEIQEELSAGEQEIAKVLGNPKLAQVPYPAELLAARRAAFLAQVEELSPVAIGEELSAGDQQIVRLLSGLKSAQVPYPAELLAARRSAFLRQAAGVEPVRLLDRVRLAISRIFPARAMTQAAPSTGFLRISFVLASLLAAVWIGSLLLSGAEQSFQASPLQVAGAPTNPLPARTAKVALTVCQPADRAPSCASGEFSPDQDLADPGNGPAQPAVSNDARASGQGIYRASYVNDGRQGPSWVSNSPDSWIKIDLGKVTTINTVSLQKGSLNSSADNDLGQFVIAVALRDVYTDGNNSNDYTEYAQVFSSKQTSFSGAVSSAATVQTQFPATRARYVKITFEKEGAAIQEVGVFMAPPPGPLAQGTSTPQDDPTEITLTPVLTNTPLLADTATAVATGALLPTDTAVLLPTNTLLPSSTPTPLPTTTQAAADTPTPLPTYPLASDTPLPPPTATPGSAPTAIPPTVPPAPVNTDPIVVTGNDQTLTFACDGNAAEIRGHSNTVTLWGSCSSITVTGNGNRVFWQSGSPLIRDQGKDNIITQR
jgi:hypothetical protein